jgi:hypothetical protein
MALPTFLELVNDVLVRIREPEVTTVNENVLSKLIGKLVNDAKRQVEDAYTWNALSNTTTALTRDGIFNYTLTGSNHRFKIIDVFNANSRTFMSNIDKHSMTMNLLGNETQQKGIPQMYSVNGIDINGDTAVDIFPVPDGEYQIFFNFYDPQPNLSSDSDQMIVPSEPVIHLAYAKACVERGEDGGMQSSEAYALFKQVLADYVSIEQGRTPEDECWRTT